MNNSTSQATPADPLRKLNPQPKQAYRITLTITGAPGPLVLTDARAQFDVTNENVCGKAKPAGGVYRMTSNEPLTLNKVSDTVYEGIVHPDQILDEDYYGDGVCHWEFTQVRASFSATGDPVETGFVPSLDANKVMSQKYETRYFWKGSYPRMTSDGFSDSGDTDRSQFNHPDNDLFTITMSAIVVQP